MAPRQRTVGRATRREGGFHHLGARIGEAGGMEAHGTRVAGSGSAGSAGATGRG